MAAADAGNMTSADDRPEAAVDDGRPAADYSSAVDGRPAVTVDDRLAAADGRLAVDAVGLLAEEAAVELMPPLWT